MSEKRKCPQCKKPVLPRATNPSFPFCSERCRMLDLGAWLEGAYRIPGPPVTLPDEPGEASEGAEGSADPTIH